MPTQKTKTLFTCKICGYKSTSASWMLAEHGRENHSIFEALWGWIKHNLYPLFSLPEFDIPTKMPDKKRIKEIMKDTGMSEREIVEYIRVLNAGGYRSSGEFWRKK